MQQGSCTDAGRIRPARRAGKGLSTKLEDQKNCIVCILLWIFPMTIERKHGNWQISFGETVSQRRLRRPSGGCAAHALPLVIIVTALPEACLHAQVAIRQTLDQPCRVQPKPKRRQCISAGGGGASGQLHEENSGRSEKRYFAGNRPWLYWCAPLQTLNAKRCPNQSASACQVSWPDGHLPAPLDKRQHFPIGHSILRRPPRDCRAMACARRREKGAA
jgi:hypothetical protein